MEEIWKDVPGYEDSYQISSHGNVRSKERYRKVCGGSFRLVKSQIIKPVICTNGYREVHLQRNRHRDVVLLHRLVAQVFIPNPLNLPEVNHKDEDITNCQVENLEWCTSKYNANYGTRNRRCWEHNTQKLRVRQLTLDGEFVREYDSIGQAANAVGVTDSPIVRVCKGKQRTSKGYIWEYVDR